MLSSHKYLQLTQVGAFFMFFLSLSLCLSPSLSLPCQLSRQVAICDFSTNQRQISRRVRIIFTFGLANIVLDFYRSSVIVIGYWTLEVLVWLFEGFFLFFGKCFLYFTAKLSCNSIEFHTINQYNIHSFNQSMNQSLTALEVASASVWAKAFGLGF